MINEQVRQLFDEYWLKTDKCDMTREQAVVYAICQSNKLFDPALSEWDVMCHIPHWKDLFFGDITRDYLSNDESKSIECRAKQLGVCWKRYLWLRAYNYINNRNSTYIRQRKKMKTYNNLIMDGTYMDEYDIPDYERKLTPDSLFFTVVDEVFKRSDVKENIQLICMLVTNEGMELNQACELAGITRHRFRVYMHKLEQSPEFVSYLNSIGVHIDGINELCN